MKQRIAIDDMITLVHGFLQQNPDDQESTEILSSLREDRASGVLEVDFWQDELGEYRVKPVRELH